MKFRNIQSWTFLLMAYAWAVSLKMVTSQRTPNTIKLMERDRFGDKNQVNQSNFNATILNVSEKFAHPISHVFIFRNMFPGSHGFVAVLVTRSKNFVSLHSLKIGWGLIGTCTVHAACNRHINDTVTLRKHVLSNFSENWRIVALKWIQLTQLLSPNLSIYCNFNMCCALLW